MLVGFVFQGDLDRHIFQAPGSSAQLTGMECDQASQTEIWHCSVGQVIFFNPNVRLSDLFVVLWVLNNA